MFDQKTLASITSTLKAGQYSLLLGAGISLDSTNSVGQKLPGGNQFRLDLCRLKGARESSTLQRVFSKLTSTEIEEYVVKRFQGCKPGPSLKYVPEFVWRRIIHSMSTTRLRLHMGHQTSFNASIVYLHGGVGTPDKPFVFATSEYVRQIKAINPWMVVLTQFLSTKPFIIIGASLDEVDLEFSLIGVLRLPGPTKVRQF